MKHATAWGDPHADRNYFMATVDGPDDRECASLAAQGLMRRYRQCDRYNGYEVTPTGYEALERLAPQWPADAKAYRCEAIGWGPEGVVLVFALTPGQAHSTTLRQLQNADDTSTWRDIRVRRWPAMDDAVLRRNGRRALRVCFKPSDMTSGGSA